MGLSFFELCSVVHECKSFVGARIQKITQPSPFEFVFQLRFPGQTIFLYFCTIRHQERMHLVSQRPKSMNRPTAFCMKLRKTFHDSKLQDIRVLNHDRIVELVFVRKGEMNRLIFEAIPRKGNILLCSLENKLVCLLSNLSHSRKCIKNALYELPPCPKEQSVWIEPAPFLLHGSEDIFSQCRISRRVANRYVGVAQEEKLHFLKKTLLGKKKKTLKKKERLLQNLHGDFERFRVVEHVKNEAELLKHNLYQVHKGQRFLKVVDYFHPEMKEATIELDPSKSPQENLEYRFKKIKKAHKGMEMLSPRISRMCEEISNLKSGIEKIKQVISVDDLLDFGELGEMEHVLLQAKSKVVSLPYHEFFSRLGQRILVGRNARCNDVLTFRIARGNDMWMHVRGAGGSHVLLPLERKQVLSSECLLDGATLAMHFSRCRGQGSADVLYTKAKYVKKPKNSSDGAVILQQDRNLFIRMEEKRLDRLLSQIGT